jgi:hypothetical protein
VRNQPAPAYRWFRIVYACLTLNFVVPAFSYIVAPSMLIDSMDRINRALGGGPYRVLESGHVWHMLAVGNVMTLGWMCAMLLFDLRRFFPILPALAFLKGFSSIYALAIGIRHALPVFLFVFVLDGATTFAIVYFAVCGYRALPPADAPPPSPSARSRGAGSRFARMQLSLDRIARSGLVPTVPNVWQVRLGILRMWGRLLFRSETVGTSAQPVRRTWRARLLRFRFVRFFPLVWERAIAPFDLSGLKSAPERIMHHLIVAHHDDDQFVYDLELLSTHVGRLEELRDAVRMVLESDAPRAHWLRDLVVFEGYHESLLAAVEQAIAGHFVCRDPFDPDISLRGYLAWCARQPATPGETWHALTRGELHLA